MKYHSELWKQPMMNMKHMIWVIGVNYEVIERDEVRNRAIKPTNVANEGRVICK